MKEINSIEALEFSIGGYFADYSYEINVKGNTASFAKHEMPRGMDGWSEVQLDEAQLGTFISALNDVGVLKWKKSYDDPGMLDGTQWELKIKYNEDAKLKCYGSNDYPTAFDRLTQALAKLIQRPGFFEE